MTDQEMLEAIKALLYPINNKLDNIALQFKSIDAKIAAMDAKIAAMDAKISTMDSRISTLDLRLSNLEHQMKKGFRKNDQDIETLVKALELKEILPKAQ